MEKQASHGRSEAKGVKSETVPRLRSSEVSSKANADFERAKDVFLQLVQSADVSAGQVRGYANEDHVVLPMY